MPPNTLNKVKRTRYFPGKRTSRTPSSSCSSDEEVSEAENVEKEEEVEETQAISEFTITSSKDLLRGTPKPQISGLKESHLVEKFGKSTKAEQFPMKLDEKESESEEEEDDDDDEDGDDDDDDDDDDDSSDVSSSEEEESKKILFRPMFVPKSKRTGNPTSASQTPDRDLEEERKQRKKEETLAMIEEQIRREKEAQEIANIHEENAAVQSAADIDDTDDLDPQAERAAWKLRELRRVKREREELELREQELREIEERRNMDEDERLKEDLERVRKQREEKARSRGKMGFMQKYYHRGAFYQDMDILKRADYATENVEDAVKDKSVLPKALQVREDQIGKRGRTRYTHLLDQDTSKGSDSPWFKRDTINKRAQDKLGGLHDTYPNKRKK
ncbi:splicing factor, Prp19-binding domain-containing protein [Dipodascopsis uninucleata]